MLIFIYIFDWAIKIYLAILMVRVVFSWISPRSFHPVHIFTKKMTEPLLKPLRKWGYYRSGNMIIDASPIILFLALMLVRELVFSLLGSLK